MKRRGKTFRYSRHFREEVLREIRRDNLTVLEAGNYYGVSFQSIYRWLKKENIPNPQKEVFYVSLSEKNNILKKYEQLKKENQELKDAVSQLSLDKICLEKLVEVAEREYKIDFKKKSGTSVSKNSGK